MWCQQSIGVKPEVERNCDDVDIRVFARGMDYKVVTQKIGPSTPTVMEPIGMTNIDEVFFMTNAG